MRPRQNVHQDVHVLGSYNEKEISTEEQVQMQKKVEKRQVPAPMMYMNRLSDQQRHKLAETFSEYELNQALEDARWYKSKGKVIQNLFAFFWNRARMISKKIRGGR